MARPRKFPDLADAEPRLSSEGGINYMPDRLEGITLTKVARDYMRNEVQTLVHPTPAGYFDPVTIMSVLDMLLRLEHDTTVRPRDLVPLLQQHYPNLIWKPIVVGRVMSDLCEAASAQANPPLTKAMSFGGHRYAITVDAESWSWLLKAREGMAQLAKRTIEIERATGEPMKRTSFPFEALEIDIAA